MKILGIAIAALGGGCILQENLGNTEGDDVDASVPGPGVSPRWAISLGAGWNDRAVSAAIDPDGDVIVGGVFSHETDFGAGLIASPQPPSCCGDGSDTLYNSTGFVTKRAATDGSHLWTVILDAAVDAGINAVTADARVARRRAR